MEALATKLKELRLEKGWSSNKVANQLLISASTYREWERTGKVSIDALMQLASLYAVSFSSLLGQARESNLELERAVRCLEEGLEHIKKALVAL